jgi:hypothetical protein
MTSDMDLFFIKGMFPNSPSRENARQVMSKAQDSLKEELTAEEYEEIQARLDQSTEKGKTHREKIEIDLAISIDELERLKEKNDFLIGFNIPVFAFGIAIISTATAGALTVPACILAGGCLAMTLAKIAYNEYKKPKLLSKAIADIQGLGVKIAKSGDLPLTAVEAIMSNDDKTAAKKTLEEGFREGLDRFSRTPEEEASSVMHQAFYALEKRLGAHSEKYKKIKEGLKEKSDSDPKKTREDEIKETLAASIESWQKLDKTTTNIGICGIISIGAIGVLSMAVVGSASIPATIALVACAALYLGKFLSNENKKPDIASEAIDGLANIGAKVAEGKEPLRAAAEEMQAQKQVETAKQPAKQSSQTEKLAVQRQASPAPSSSRDPH